MLHQNGPELLQNSEESVKEPLVQDNALKEKWGSKKISHSAALNWKIKKTWWRTTDWYALACFFLKKNLLILKWAAAHGSTAEINERILA